MPSRRRITCGPALLAIPLDARTDFEILLFANLMTMTPGSVTVDISKDRRTLYLHVMYVEDAEEIRRSIKQDFERRVLRLLR
jgi:multicomponent Na+:H+ antiporter subunit E